MKKRVLAATILCVLVLAFSCFLFTGCDNNGMTRNLTGSASYNGMTLGTYTSGSQITFYYDETNDCVYVTGLTINVDSGSGRYTGNDLYFQKKWGKSKLKKSKYGVGYTKSNIAMKDRSVLTGDDYYEVGNGVNPGNFDPNKDLYSNYPNNGNTFNYKDESYADGSSIGGHLLHATERDAHATVSFVSRDGLPSGTVIFVTVYITSGVSNYGTYEFYAIV